MRKPPEMFCSFCGKSQHAVEQLIAGPKVFICNECVDTCIEILGSRREWCDREIANLKRLRKHARNEESEHHQPDRAQPDRRPGWLARLWR